jgi:ribose transport system permease protein
MTSLPPPLPPRLPGSSDGSSVDWKSLLNTFGALLALGLAYALFAAVGTESFRTVAKLEDIVRATAQVGFAALGMTVIIIVGGIDLSVGSLLGLTAVLVAVLMRDAHFSPLGAAVSAVAAGALCGAINGLLIVGLRVVPFIVTLGTLLVARGATIWLADKSKVGAPEQWLFELASPGEAALNWSGSAMTVLVVSWVVVGAAALLGGMVMGARAYRWGRRRPRPQGLPWALAVGITWYGLAGLIAWRTYTWPAGLWLLAAMAVVMAGVLRYTRFGRHAFAVGSNELTARLCGVRVWLVKLLAFCIGGAFAGLAGVMSFSRLHVGDCTAGEGAELDVIAAVVIGGGSLAGGEGSILGSLVGAMIMSVIAAGCTDLNIDNWVQKIVTGAIIIAAVALDRLRHRRAA